MPLLVPSNTLQTLPKAFAQLGSLLSCSEAEWHDCPMTIPQSWMAKRKEI